LTPTQPPVSASTALLEALPGFADEDFRDAYACFLRSAARITRGEPSQRPAVLPDANLLAACRATLALGEQPTQAEAREFFLGYFQPFRLAAPGFVTAYYEPEVEARLAPEPDFAVPVLGRPADLVSLNHAPISGPGGLQLGAARRLCDGSLVPYPDRREIEDDPAYDRSGAIAFVRDRVELFLIQVQGSARLRLPDGGYLALTYDGRNGYPYTSVGKLLLDCGLVAPDAMSLAELKRALRAMGQGFGSSGATLMQENRSYVFFRIDRSEGRHEGPVGGAGCVLTPLRSIAVDRSIWTYGLPFWIETSAPWEGAPEKRLERLMIAQDTGSAILGAARADLFYGYGEAAGALAGQVRNSANVFVLWPKREDA
jgi:membrane-bound lytic murein transglycosylase A